ncbi:hypothetical protein RJ639_042780 [Escallonia herrerae]|uniref:Gnk2-homologous domain-containing protein n=1 Tax=Escallonia herrerae TaxID=1293975 RepID=A0AA89B418_9ASTE|nr:hypothetical protein RJ639_042780 [Escallonia herrerae]
MDNPRLSFWFLFILNFLVSLTTPQPAPRYNFCSTSGNYTTESTYSRNLNDLLSSIPTSADLDSDGFFNASIGQNPDQVYAIGLCRGDLTVASCLSCLNNSVQAITQACPNQKEAGLWYDACMLRFSNRSILSSMDDGFLYVAWNVYNQTTPYDNVLEDLLPDLRDQAAAGGVRKYAPGEIEYMGHWTIHALEQCTPDISGLDCKKCLDSAIKDVFTYCTGRYGCFSIKPSCVLRFESYEFLQTAADAPSPTPIVAPPPPPLVAPPPPILLQSPPPVPTNTPGVLAPADFWYEVRAFYNGTLVDVPPLAAPPALHPGMSRSVPFILHYAGIGGKDIG